MYGYKYVFMSSLLSSRQHYISVYTIATENYSLIISIISHTSAVHNITLPTYFLYIMCHPLLKELPRSVTYVSVSFITQEVYRLILIAFACVHAHSESERNHRWESDRRDVQLL